MIHNHAYIGREFSKSYGTNKECKEYKLTNPIYLDFTLKEHNFIVAKSGSGKSYLAGVLAEEMISKMENYAVVILDPIGIFSTLSQKNKMDEIDNWNSSLGRNEISSEAISNYKIWIPAGDKKHFEVTMFDKIFSLKINDISASMLCYAFNMDIMDTQMRLYTTAQSIIEEEDPNYSLEDLKEFIFKRGKSLHYRGQTIEALLSKLNALQELKIVSDKGVSISDVVKENQAIIFDLSMSSTYTSRLVINFFADQLLKQRKKIAQKLKNAKKNGEKIFIEDYFPPIQLLIDEAHKYIPNNKILKEFIKEGRNIGCMLTAISQSFDLSKDVYSNISQLFVGQMIFQDDIDKVKSMVALFGKSSREFRIQVMDLDVGCFFYYNLNKKTEKKIRIRARKTLHPASTELEDERKYLLDEDPKLPGMRLIAEELKRKADEFYASAGGN